MVLFERDGDWDSEDGYVPTNVIQARMNMKKSARSTSSNAPPPWNDHTETFCSLNSLQDELGYKSWSDWIRRKMGRQGMVYLETGTEPEEWSLQDTEAWNTYAVSLIWASVEPDAMQPESKYEVFYVDDPSASDMWKKLRKEFGTIPTRKLASVVNKLFSNTTIPSSPDEFSTFRFQFSSGARALKHNGMEVSEMVLVTHLMARIPDELSLWAMNMWSNYPDSSSLPCLDEFFDMLQHSISSLALRQSLRATSISSSPSTSKSKRNKLPSQPCPACNTGDRHWAKKCPDLVKRAAWLKERAAQSAASPNAGSMPISKI